MKPHIVILGAGPAGLGAAWKLAQTGKASVTVLEQNERVGGNAGSFSLAGLCVDYGSHRLHPATDPEILSDIRLLLGDDLLDRPRHGRIRLGGRWIHFPLKPVDLALRLPPSFLLGVLGDTGRKLLARGGAEAGGDSFATVMERGLGRTICRDFYFPYARKIWGAEPDALSAIQARRRVSAGSLGKMVRRVLNAVPGFKPLGAGRFFYPRQGYGQISEAYAQAARSAGAEIRLGARVEGVERRVDSFTVRAVRSGEPLELSADYVWSTLPVTILARGLQPAPPAEVLAATGAIEYRAMILIYLVLEQDHFSEWDAHYFPQPEIPITRLSEPKNYSASSEPHGLTVLCAELPCSPDDTEWAATEDELGQLVCASLERAGIPVRAPVRQTLVRRLRFAYPIYRQGYERPFQALDHFVDGIDGLLSFGRQGLFAHDNTHHALFMAYCAAACLDESGRFDQARWQSYRKVFETHVVED